MNKTRTKKMTIPDELRKELEAIPSGLVTSTGLEWTDEMDAILLEYYPIKKRDDMIAWWKNRYGWGCRETLIRRYRKLTEAR